MARIGLALILIGGSFYAGVYLWQATRIWVPVDIPILLSRGVTRTDDFKLNLNSSYVIYIVVDEGSNRQETLCLTGMEQCDGKPSILQAHWTLFDHGKPIATGNADHDKEGFASWKIYRELGVFTADKGKHYSLAIDIQEDASLLKAANPQLFVQENGEHWIYDSSGGAVLFLVATIFIVLGLILLARSIFTTARERRDRMRIAFTFPGPEPKTLYINTEKRQLVPVEPFTTNTKSHAWIGVCLLILGLASCIGPTTGI